MGAFEDVRAALDAAPGDEALNRAARELAAEATRGGARETRGRASATDGEFADARAVPAAYRALGVSRDADARSIRRAYAARGGDVAPRQVDDAFGGGAERGGGGVPPRRRRVRGARRRQAAQGVRRRPGVVSHRMMTLCTRLHEYILLS